MCGRHDIDTILIFIGLSINTSALRSFRKSSACEKIIGTLIPGFACFASSSHDDIHFSSNSLLPTFLISEGNALLLSL